MKIGFIGIGVMGSAIVEHLLKNDYTVIGYSRTKAKVQAQIEHGMIWAEDVATVVTEAELIFTMVGFPQDVHDIYFGKNAILANATQGQIFVDLTTSKPSLAKEITIAAAKKGVTVLDAPVSGGDIGAIKGNLVMMVGGDQQTFTEISPILELFTHICTYFGPAGSGQHMKMANQIAIATNLLGMAESLTYAKNAGLDLNEVLPILSGGSAESWQITNNGPKAINSDYSPGFYIKHFVKDMRIAIEEAQTFGVDLPNLQLAEELFSILLDEGNGDLGTQAIYKLYNK